MNKKSALLAFSIIFFVVAAVLGINGLLKQIENPAICSKCHAMEPFYESYFDTEDYILIRVHKDEGVTCIDCHSPIGRENRDKVRMIILKKIVSYVYTGNVVADTSLLKADCTKCHDVDITFNDTEINPHAGVQTCRGSCHLVHEDLILGDFVEMDCAECHVEPDMTGRHANVNCVGCHSIHGIIPSCTGCHAPHDDASAKVQNSECLICHGSSAHMLAEVIYDEKTVISTTVCAGCHEEQYQKICTAVHGDMGTCVGCHPSHGTVKPCIDCHYAKHMSIHSPIMENKNVTENRCTVCHVEIGPDVHTGCTDCHIQDPHSI